MHTVTSPGTTSGSMTRVSIAKVEQPSIRAASSISRGTVSNALRIMNTENGSCSVAYTRGQPDQRVLQPHIRQHQKERRHHRLKRDHQLQDDQHEQHVLAAKLEPREPVTR